MCRPQALNRNQLIAHTTGGGVGTGIGNAPFKIPELVGKLNVNRQSTIVGGVATAIFWGVWRRLVTKNSK